MRNVKKIGAACLVATCLFMTACGMKVDISEDVSASQPEESVANTVETTDSSGECTKGVTTSNGGQIDLSNIPVYSGQPYVEINSNQPTFPEEDKNDTEFEMYSKLDGFGRCGVAYANICQDLMPTEERGEIGMVKPSGWHTVKYSGIVDGNYLYNRCHLIAYCLAGENANTKNLITGTRYMNVKGMLPFEEKVANYVDRTNNHVLYRVTPIYEGDNLVASGVQMEAYSVEDKGTGICYNIYVYNVQPGIGINYATGDSWIDDSNMGNVNSQTASTNNGTAEDVSSSYVLNKKSKKFHKEDCGSASKISEKNRESYSGSRQELINQGYEPCKECNP